MTSRRAHRLLYLSYGALFTWLAFCAVQSAIKHSPWACSVFALGSAFAVIAFMREGALEDALRREATRAEREARPTPATPNAADASDDVVAVALAAACCEQWWASAGADHEPTCPNHQHRSAA